MRFNNFTRRADSSVPDTAAWAIVAASSSTARPGTRFYRRWIFDPACLTASALKADTMPSLNFTRMRVG